VMKKNTKYRGRICVSPALIMNVPEPDWHDGNPTDPDNRQDYRMRCYNQETSFLK
jgi:hypothetical protein